LEDDLLALIRRYGLPEPVPQYQHNGRRIDFAYPELEIGIEADSVLAHAAKQDVQRNAEKANDLLEWWMVYFTPRRRAQPAGRGVPPDRERHSAALGHGGLSAFAPVRLEPLPV
jgi:hypothetical protein